MDPIALLAEIRELYRRIQENGEVADLGGELSEKIEDLDHWLKDGGFSPWAKPGTVAAEERLALLADGIAATMKPYDKVVTIGDHRRGIMVGADMDDDPNSWRDIAFGVPDTVAFDFAQAIREARVKRNRAERTGSA